MKVEPNLGFNGRCEEAVRFYERALGAKVEMMMRYREAPDPAPPGMLPPGSEEKIMHCSFRIGETTVMATDDMRSQGARLEGFSLAITLMAETDADRVFNALADGGKVIMPLGKTFWSPRFGMLQDRFGVSWMVNVTADQG